MHSSPQTHGRRKPPAAVRSRRSSSRHRSSSARPTASNVSAERRPSAKGVRYGPTAWITRSPSMNRTASGRSQPARALGRWSRDRRSIGSTPHRPPPTRAARLLTVMRCLSSRGSCWWSCRCWSCGSPSRWLQISARSPLALVLLASSAASGLRLLRRQGMSVGVPLPPSGRPGGTPRRSQLLDGAGAAGRRRPARGTGVRVRRVRRRRRCSPRSVWSCYCCCSPG